MKRTALLRRTPMARSFSRLARTAIPRQRRPLKRTPLISRRSSGAKRQDNLRKKAYAIVDERSGGWCEATTDLCANPQHRCRNQVDQHHHRRPRKAGGSQDPTTETAANILGLCVAHHQGIESARDFARSLGLLVEAGHDPAATPVLLWCGWSLLLPDGSVEQVVT